MDYEKKYKHALDLAKQVHDTTISKQQKENIETIFPELAESKDEKVRKWIYNYFRSLFPTWIHPDITCEEILDWLEKQGEQKPAWGEEDERSFHHVLSVLEEYGEEHPSNSKFVCNWLKSIKARMGGDKV